MVGPNLVGGPNMVGSKGRESRAPEYESRESKVLICSNMKGGSRAQEYDAQDPKK